MCVGIQYKLAFSLLFARAGAYYCIVCFCVSIRVHELLARVRSRPFEVMTFRTVTSGARACDGMAVTAVIQLYDICVFEGLRCRDTVLQNSKITRTSRVAVLYAVQLFSK